MLFLPFAIPLVTGRACGCRCARFPRKQAVFDTLEGLGFLALYDTIFALLGWALFEYVVED